MLDIVFGNRALASVLLGLAGVLVAHEVAYRIAAVFGWAGQTLLPHGHMATLWAVLGPVAAVVISWLAIRQTRALRLDRRLSTPHLTLAIIAPFLALETVEHMQSGATALEALTAAPTLLGVLMALPVAYVLARSVDVVRDVVEAVKDALASAGRRFRGEPRLIPVRIPVDAPRRRVVEHDSFDRRGPPPLS